MPEDMQEREIGILPYEQRDVDSALQRLEKGIRKSRQVVERPIGGGAINRDAPREILKERDGEDRDRDRRIEAALRSREPYDSTVDIIRKHRNPDAIKWKVRREIARQERNIDDFDDYLLRGIKKNLNDRAELLDPETIGERMEKYDLAEYGFGGETPKNILDEMQAKLEELEQEAVVFENMAERTVETNKELAGLYRMKAEHARRSAENYQKEHQDALASFSLEGRRKLARELRMLAEEVRIREKINTAYFLYERSAGDMPTTAQLFIDSRYAMITSREWQTLLSLSKTESGEDGEQYSFGKKIDLVMRLLALIGTGGGDIRTEGKIDPVKLEQRKADIKGAIGKIKQKSREVGAISWTEGFITEEDITVLAGKNLFCGGATQSEIELVKEWMVHKIGGDGVDTRAALGIGLKLFSIWQLKTQFDNKRFDTEAGRNTPAGFPDSDDWMKVFHYNAQVAKDASKGYPHGPDATFGEYPDVWAVSFLHSLTTGEGEEKRSFWEKWFYEGVDLGNLPWAKLEKQAEEDIEAQLLEDALDKTFRNVKDSQKAVEEAERILKEAKQKNNTEEVEKAEKTIKDERAKAVAEAERIMRKAGENTSSSRTYSWRSHLLQGYFLGREAGREPEKPGGVWQIAQRERWSFSEIINIMTLAGINKSLNIGLGQAMLSKGEWAEWFKTEQGNYKNWAKKRTKDNSWEDYIEEQMENTKAEFRKQILVGAITRDFQVRGRIAAADWGIWIPTMLEKTRLPLIFSSSDEIKGKHRRTTLMPSIFRDAKFETDYEGAFNYSEDWLKKADIAA